MSQPLSGAERGKFSAAKAATALVKDGMKVGLGTGSTAAWLVRHLAEMVRKDGLRIQAAATSVQTATLAMELGIKTQSLDELGWLDVTIDGADEFDGQFNLLKGGGGALLREKIVACASDSMAVIADVTKGVANLGKFPLPVEVIPFGSECSSALIERALLELGYQTAKLVLRERGGSVFVTDQGNHIFDLHLDMIRDPKVLSQTLNDIPGVVENGLFLNMCDTIIIGFEDGSSETRRLVDGAIAISRANNIENLFPISGAENEI